MKSLDGIWNFVKSNESSPTEGIREKWYLSDLKKVSAIWNGMDALEHRGGDIIWALMSFNESHFHVMNRTGAKHYSNAGASQLQ